MSTFNSSQTSGNKTIVEIQTKYRNMKCASKKDLSTSAKEIKKTGGGSAQISLSNNFNFSAAQIVGIPNRFDSDSVATSKSISIESEEDNDDDVRSTPTTSFSTPKPVTYSNKKMRLSSVKHDLIDLKTEGMKLDIENKKLENESKKLDIENKKLDIECKKLLIKKVEAEIATISGNIEPK